LVASDGKLNMRRHFQMRRAADGATLARGDWDLVCIRISTGRATRMPAEFLACYQPAVINPDSGPAS
jgi:acyl-CoA thioester hydrolase